MSWTLLSHIGGSGLTSGRKTKTLLATQLRRKGRKKRKKKEIKKIIIKKKKEKEKKIKRREQPNQ